MTDASSANHAFTRWHLLAAGGLLAAGAWITRDAWADLIRLGLKDEESSHVLLAPIVVVGLLWVRRHLLAKSRPTGLFAGPLCVVAGGMCYSIGDTQLWQSVWHLGAILIAVGCLLTVVGAGVARRVLPAILALAFLVPLPNRVRQAVAMPLASGAARVTEHTFNLLGMPVERSGKVLRLNGRDVGIEEACNGMRMVIAMLLASYAVAFALPLGVAARCAILLLSPVTALVFNVVRLVPTVWIYGNGSTTAAEMFHVWSGWAMLIVAFLTLMGFLRLMSGSGILRSAARPCET